MGPQNISQQYGVNQAHLNVYTSSASVRHGEFSTEKPKDTISDEKKVVDSKTESWLKTILYLPVRSVKWIFRKLFCIATLGYCFNDNEVKLSAKEQLNKLEDFAKVKSDEKKAKWADLNKENPSIQKTIIDDKVNEVVKLERQGLPEDKKGTEALKQKHTKEYTASFKEFNAQAQELVDAHIEVLRKEVADADSKDKASK